MNHLLDLPTALWVGTKVGRPAPADWVGRPAPCGHAAPEAHKYLLNVDLPKIFGKQGRDPPGGYSRSGRLSVLFR